MVEKVCTSVLKAAMKILCRCVINLLNFYTNFLTVLSIFADVLQEVVLDVSLATRPE